MVRFRNLLVVPLLLASFEALALEPRLGEELPLGASRVASRFVTAEPFIAYNGEEFLLVAERATRITREGTALDPFGIDLDTLDDSLIDVQDVVSVGRTFLIIRRLSVTVIARDQTPAPTVRFPYQFTGPAAVSGTTIAIPARDPSTNAIGLALLEWTGSDVIFKTFVDFSLRAQTIYSVEQLGSGFAAITRALNNAPQILVYPLTNAGVVGTARVIDAPPVALVKTASTGQTVLVVWLDDETALEVFRAATVSATTVSPTATLYRAVFPTVMALVAVGERFYILRIDQNVLTAIELSRLGAPSVLRETSINAPSITETIAAAAGDRVLLAFGDRDRGCMTSRVVNDAFLPLSSDFAPFLAIADQVSPDVAGGPRNALTVWSERNQACGFDVRAALVNPDGTQTELGVIAGASFDPRPAAVWGTGLYLVSWRADDGIRAVRITEAGTVADAQAISLIQEPPPSESQAPLVSRRSDVGWNGQEFVVVWTDRIGQTILAARVTIDGSVLDVIPVEVGSSTAVGSPRIVWTGTDFFVAWNSFILAARPAAEVCVRRFTDTLLATGPSSCSGFGYTSVDMRFPVATLDGTTLVSWAATTHPSAVARSLFERLYPPGLTGTNASVEIGGIWSDGAHDAIAERSSFAVVYLDGVTDFNDSVQVGLWTFNVEKDGTLSPPVLIEPQGLQPTDLILFQTLGRTGVVYTRDVDGPTGVTSRLFTRFFDQPPRSRGVRR